MFTIDTDTLPQRDGIVQRATYRQIPTLIEQAVGFDGNTMSGRVISDQGLSPVPWEAGDLGFDDRVDFYRDATAIRYVVRSYETPIAWMTLSGRWHIVTSFFSMTTRKHQSRLYLVGENHQASVRLVGRRPSMWAVDCATCEVKVVTNACYDNRREADDAAHHHRRNG